MTNDEERKHEEAHLQSRLYILQGLLAVLDQPRSFIEVVLRSGDVSDATESLRKIYGLSEIQAQAALDMQIRRLDQESRMRIRSDFAEMQTELARLRTSPT